jgi:hypothetical protein
MVLCGSILALAGLLLPGTARPDSERPVLLGLPVAGETLRVARVGAATERIIWWRCGAAARDDDGDDDDAAHGVALDDDACAPIAGEGGAAYVVRAADVGFRLQVSAAPARGDDDDDDDDDDDGVRWSRLTDVVRAPAVTPPASGSPPPGGGATAPTPPIPPPPPTAPVQPVSPPPATGDARGSAAFAPDSTSTSSGCPGSPAASARGRRAARRTAPPRHR